MCLATGTVGVASQYMRNLLGCFVLGEDETKVWCTLPPEDFRPYAVPFKLEGDTKVGVLQFEVIDQPYV